MSIECLDDLPDDALFLESSGPFERYQTGAEANGDGLSTWFCTDCGQVIDDPTEGCPMCDETDLEEACHDLA